MILRPSGPSSGALSRARRVRTGVARGGQAVQRLRNRRQTSAVSMETGFEDANPAVPRVLRRTRDAFAGVQTFENCSTPNKKNYFPQPNPRLLCTFLTVESPPSPHPLTLTPRRIPANISSTKAGSLVGYLADETKGKNMMSRVWFEHFNHAS